MKHIPHTLQHMLWLMAIALLPACGSTAQLPPSPEPTTPAAAQPTTLSIYNYDTYIDPAILENFSQQFGIEVIYNVYKSSVDEAIPEVVTGEVGQYDLIVVSDYIVATLRRNKMLSPLNKQNIPNIANLDPLFLNTIYDPGNRYCLPYQWGMLGIGYNIAQTGRELNSWADLFDPAFAGRIALYAEPRITFGVVLLMLGYSPNTTDQGQFNQAKEWLIQHADQIAIYSADDGQDLLLAGEVDLTIEWNGDMLQLVEENPDLRFVAPREGTLLITDYMCIPHNAPNQPAAEKFINYLLEPEVGAALSNYVRYATPNQASLPFVNQADRNNPAIYPPAEIRAKLFSIADLGQAFNAFIEATWAEVIAAHQIQE